MVGLGQVQVLIVQSRLLTLPLLLGPQHLVSLLLTSFLIAVFAIKQSSRKSLLHLVLAPVFLVLLVNYPLDLNVDFVSSSRSFVSRRSVSDVTKFLIIYC